MEHSEMMEMGQMLRSQDSGLLVPSFLYHISLSIWGGDNAEIHTELLTPHVPLQSRELK